MFDGLGFLLLQEIFFCRVLDIRVPENVIISEWQVVLLKEAPETVLHCPRLQRPLCAGKQATILLVLHLAQYGKHFRRQRNSANGVFAFRRL